MPEAQLGTGASLMGGGVLGWVAKVVVLRVVTKEGRGKVREEVFWFGWD